MASRFPAGRCGTKEFCTIAGIGPTTFFMSYRHDPYYIELFDLRVDALNRLNMSLAAAKAFAAARAGQRPHGNTGRFKTRPCPACKAATHVRVNHCSSCGEQIRWPCASCGRRSDYTEARCRHCGAPRVRHPAEQTPSDGPLV